MKNIVTLKANTAQVTVKNISTFSKVSERAIVKTVRTNEKEFRSLGLSFPSDLSHIHQVLNESQATFLMTLLKNTPVVVAFKLELVKQFMTMREKEMLKMHAKLKSATSLKTYKYGQVSLRKYLRDSGKKILEDDAWQELEDLGIIETKIIPVKTRHLLDGSFGSQTHKTLSFDIGMLDTIL